MERELIRERVKTGIEAAAAKGRKGGRPKALSKKQIKKARSLKVSGEFSVKEICKLMGISRSVFYRAIKDDN
jgi:DNA invertase Pin-like site-specific DNA recombinase